ncbi:hypothetical protein GO730_28870 [Spirosoma sp. HMF3257]|uniref:Uncharacterized protein n=1 Tax=Spirosoma telluris TaxID=2183553 RepID=A0A327NRB6_9BACT|nr:hypothetical protein [Spirosoma telluris]RAI77193.1 hypothetical protein HMF3257_28795 [Spirosoma telluris]
MRLFFAILFCFLPVYLFGQYHNRPAFLTDRSEKTVSGTVRYYDWSINPDYIEFSRDSLGSTRPIPLKSIQKLVIKDGPVYEGLYIGMPYYTKNPIEIGGNVVDHIDSTYFLAELMLDSNPVKLYKLFDKEAKTRFLIAKYDSLVLLEDIHVVINRRELNYNFTDPVFRRTLKTILYECPTLNTNGTNYSEHSLITTLKQYLSFCRIDSKIYLEQKKTDKPILGIGAFVSHWQNTEGKSQVYGITMQVLLPRQFHNLFIMMDVGTTNTAPSSLVKTGLQFGIYGGRYFGRGSIQGKVYTGLSSMFTALDTGVGVSYKKIISAEIHYSPLANTIYDSSIKVLPLANLRAIIPLSR